MMNEDGLSIEFVVDEVGSCMTSALKSGSLHLNYALRTALYFLLSEQLLDFHPNSRLLL